MKVKVAKAMLYGLWAETLVLLLVVSGMLFLPASEASRLRLFEIFGALLATMLTTFGLFEMRRLT